MGAVHAQMATNCGLKLVACADTRKPKAAALAGRYGAEVVSPKAVLARDDVDIVAITTPTPTHTGYVIAAAEAGKAIFCEKPFGRTVAQCEAAIAAVEKAKVKLFVGHVVRFFHEFEAMKAEVKSGKIGRVGFVKMYRGGIFPRGEGKWFHDYAQSGGVTFDSSIHDCDWLRYAFGNADHVYCQALQRSKPEPIDYAAITFRMESGIIAHVIGTWAHPQGFRVRTEICGDKGMLQFNSEEAPISVLMRAQAGGGPSMIVPASPVAVSPYQLEWEDFLGWINRKHKPRVTPEDALEAVRMVSAALESAKSGRPVKL